MINLLNLNKILLSKLLLNVCLPSLMSVSVLSPVPPAATPSPALLLCWFCCHSLSLLNAFFPDFCILHQTDGEGGQQNSPSHLYTHGSYTDLFPQCRKKISEKHEETYQKHIRKYCEVYQLLFFSLQALWTKACQPASFPFCPFLCP